MRPSMFLIGLVTLVLMGCQEEGIVDYEETTTGVQPQVILNTGIAGKVVNEKGSPISACEIKINNRLVFSDESGFYIFQEIGIDSLGQLLQVSKEGFVTRHVYIVPVPNGIVNQDIVLKSNFSTGKISNQKAAQINLNGIQLDIEEQTFGNDSEIINLNLYIQNSREGFEFPLNLPYQDGVDDDFALPIAGFFVDARKADSNLLPVQKKPIAVKLGEYLKDYGADELYLFYYHEKDQRFRFKQKLSFPSDYVAEASANVYYLICSKPKWARVSCEIADQNGQAIEFETYLLKNLLNKTQARIQTGRNGQFISYLESGQNYEVLHQNLCNEWYKIGEISADEGSNYQLADQLGTVVSFQVLDCYYDLIHPNGYLKLLVSNGPVTFSYISSQADFQEHVFPCNEEVFMQVENGNEVLWQQNLGLKAGLEMIKNIQQENCEGQTQSFISYDNQKSILDRANLYVFFDPIGSDHLVITDFTKVFVNIRGFQGKGNYQPERVTIFGEGKFFECDASCNELTAQVIEFGQPGELCVIKLKGKIEDAEISGFFTTTRFN